MRASNPDWWTAKRRAEQAARVSPEARALLAEAAAGRWRERHPEKAVVRDEILATEKPQPCDQCGDGVTKLWVTDYSTGAHVWRCKPCAAAARRDGGSKS